MQYVKTFEMRMFNEKFTKSSWQHSAQWNILHFPDVQYRADGQIKYRAHFGLLHTSFIDGVGSYEVWCTLPHITLLVKAPRGAFNEIFVISRAGQFRCRRCQTGVEHIKQFAFVCIQNDFLWKP